MATGIPGKNPSHTHRSVSLEYEGKRSVSELLAKSAPAFHQLHSGPSDRRLYFGDNLAALKHLYSEVDIRGNVTLVYIDPPFATRGTFVSRKQRQAYEDTLTGADYVEFLRARLVLLRELLSDRGSIYLHLDETMVFEMKLVMDEVFGPSNYRNVIVRKKCNPKNYTRKRYGNVADFILFYTKSDKYVWNKPVQPLSGESQKEYYYVESGTGRRFMKVPVHAPGTRNGATGERWRGKLPPPGKHWQYTPKNLDEMDARGEICWSKNGNPRRKVYLDEHPGVGIQDVWLDFKDAHNQNVRITGYPTEKNPELLRRIIGASSNPGDIVLDCFAGSGTTLAVANEMQRHWIGADYSEESLKTVLGRFERGLSPMGDYVQKGKAGSSKSAEQKTLFDAPDEIPPPSTKPQNGYQPVTNFRVFVADDAKETGLPIVRAWQSRNNLPLAGDRKPPLHVAEKPDFADVCYHLHTRDKKIAKVIDAVGPCALTRKRVGFHFLVDAIISQQLSKGAADTIAQRFRKLFRSDRASPKAILAKPKTSVLRTGVSERKYGYIVDLCRRIQSGQLRLSDIEDQSEDVIRTSLKTVKGIGDWTVDMYLLFGLARLDVFPLRDLALRNVMSQVYRVPRDDYAKLTKLANRWKPYRSVGSWYLYKYGNLTAKQPEATRQTGGARKLRRKTA